MRGLEILARSLSVATTGNRGGTPFKHGNAWQYHPRSDRHSKIACWAIMVDLLTECSLLRAHVSSGKIGFGINHVMNDFARNRTKNLDLVICRGSAAATAKGTTALAQLRDVYNIQLTTEDLAHLKRLPSVPVAEPASVLVALEAKACMTEFGKARPRLYDELNSSHLTIHGDSSGAIAAGFAMVNIAGSFVSPLRNHWRISTQATIVSQHKQPTDARSVTEKLMQLPRRSKDSGDGFDAFAIAVVDCCNDGSSVRIHRAAPAPQPGDIYNYEQFIGRVAHLYATRFTGI